MPVASATRASVSPVRAATEGSVALSASTETARATAIASSDNRASRMITVRDTARGPISSTTPACAASGRTWSASSAVRSWRRNSGLPPVARWQASQNASSAASPSRSRTSARTASALSGIGRTATAAGSCATSPSSATSVPGSPLRTVAATSTGWPSSRRAR
jgi:hypothetical protein